LLAFQHFVSLNPDVTFANNLCLNLNAAFAKQLASQSTCGLCKQPVSQSTCDCDLHICKQLVSQALQAIVTSSAFCKQLISQDPYVIVTTYNLQLTTLMHVQNMLHKIKAPKDCSIGTQPQPVPDSNLGQVQSLAT
jgi:predicted amidophosphoribosyltransferase